jgi:hypothetical protein
MLIFYVHEINVRIFRALKVDVSWVNQPHHFLLTFIFLLLYYLGGVQKFPVSEHVLLMFVPIGVGPGFVLLFL